MDTYGCIVVFSSFVLHVLLYGTIQSFGVLYVELLDDFERGRGETSWIASLSSGAMFLFAPVSTYMEKKVGCRVLGIVGALLVSIGMALSSFIRNYIHIFYLTYGLCSGIGFCLMCTAATIPVQLYFNKRRTLAYALASSGVCVGTVLTPFLIRYLLKEFGWRGTFLLMAAINSHGCIAGALLWKPYTKNHGSEKTIGRREDSWLTDVKRIYIDRAFLLFITSNMIVVLVYFVPYVMTPDVAFRRGLTKDEGAFLVTVFGLSGAVGRVVSGFLADAKPGHKALLNAGQLFGASAAIFWSAYICDFLQFIGYAILFGFFGSSWAMLAAVLTVDIVGKQLYVVAMGLVWLHSGLFSTIGPPIAGWITDVSGSYEVTFIVAGGLFLFGAFLRIILCFHKLRLPQVFTDIPLKSDPPLDTVEPP